MLEKKTFELEKEITRNILVFETKLVKKCSKIDQGFEQNFNSDEKVKQIQ